MITEMLYLKQFFLYLTLLASGLMVVWVTNVKTELLHLQILALPDVLYYDPTTFGVLVLVNMSISRSFLF
jgi:hypothetical protein